jgi:uncharacterized protein (TIGR02646 family)
MARVMRLKEAERASYEFAAYRNPQVKAALQQLFGLRCAYCEANYAITGNMEVEHYRPKSIYYWLAAEWSNLLPSCNKCNNGKRAKFPLANDSTPARKKGGEKREVPLLLNPSDSRPERRPERHLTFDPVSGAIQARLVRGQPSAFALKSIDVYRLKRKELSDARRDWSLRVRGAIGYSRAARRAADRRLAEEGLMALTMAEAPFRALTIRILRDAGFKLPARKQRRGGAGNRP